MLKTDDVCSQIKQELLENLQDVGVLCSNYAKEECPVDTGILRASIDSLLYAEDGKAIIYANTDYAEKVHEGHGKYAGKPFLENAVYNNLEDIKARMARGR